MVTATMVTATMVTATMVTATMVTATMVTATMVTAIMGTATTVTAIKVAVALHVYFLTIVSFIVHRAPSVLMAVASKLCIMTSRTWSR